MFRLLKGCRQVSRRKQVLISAYRLSSDALYSSQDPLLQGTESTKCSNVNNLNWLLGRETVRWLYTSSRNTSAQKPSQGVQDYMENRGNRRYSSADDPHHLYDSVDNFLDQLDLDEVTQKLYVDAGMDMEAARMFNAGFVELFGSQPADGVLTRLRSLGKLDSSHVVTWLNRAQQLADMVGRDNAKAIIRRQPIILCHRHETVRNKIRALAAMLEPECPQQSTGIKGSGTSSQPSSTAPPVPVYNETTAASLAIRRIKARSLHKRLDAHTSASPDATGVDGIGQAHGGDELLPARQPEAVATTLQRASDAGVSGPPLSAGMQAAVQLLKTRARVYYYPLQEWLQTVCGVLQVPWSLGWSMLQGNKDLLFTPSHAVLGQFSALTAALFAHGLPGPRTYVTSHSRKLSKVSQPNTQGPWSLHVVYDNHQTGSRSRTFAVQPDKLPSWLKFTQAEMAFLHLPLTLRNIAVWPGIQRRDDEMMTTAQPKRRTRRVAERMVKHFDMIESASSVVSKMQLTPYLQRLISVAKQSWPGILEDSESSAHGQAQYAETGDSSAAALQRPDVLPVDEASRLLRAAEYARAVMIASPQVLFLSEATLKVRLHSLYTFAQPHGPWMEELQSLTPSNLGALLKLSTATYQHMGSRLESGEHFNMYDTPLYINMVKLQEEVRAKTKA